MPDADETGAQRRKFLKQAGKVAIATPPVLAILLSAEGRHYALALSGGGGSGGNNGNHFGQIKNGNNGNH
jgi:hypothetical protein